jgi:hypothetical protein
MRSASRMGVMLISISAAILRTSKRSPGLISPATMRSRSTSTASIVLDL